MLGIRRKQLIPVNFVYETPSGRPSSSVSSTPATDNGESSKAKTDEPGNPMCPSCKKGFSNTSLMFCRCSFSASHHTIDVDTCNASGEALRTCHLQDLHGLTGEDVEAVHRVRRSAQRRQRHHSIDSRGYRLCCRWIGRDYEEGYCIPRIASLIWPSVSVVHRASVCSIATFLFDLS